MVKIAILGTLTLLTAGAVAQAQVGSTPSQPEGSSTKTTNEPGTRGPTGAPMGGSSGGTTGGSSTGGVSGATGGQTGSGVTDSRGDSKTGEKPR